MDLRKLLQGNNTFGTAVRPQATPPASTSQFRQVQRADKGFDFFKGNNKITIEDFTRGTGANGSNLRQSLARQGDQVSQNMIAEQKAYENNPTVKGYNLLNVDQQRIKLADIQGLANRKDFNTVNDLNNQQWAQQQLLALQKAGNAKKGNLLTFGQDLVGGFIAPAQQIGNTIGDSLNQATRGNKLQNLFNLNEINSDQYKAGLDAVLQNSVDTKATQDAQGNVGTERKTPLEFAQKFGAEGANAGVTYLPIGAAYGNVAKLGLKPAAGLVAGNIAKEGTAYTVANTVNDALQGRQITPESIAMNAALSFGGAGVGASTALIRPGVAQAARTTTKLVKDTGRAIEQVNPQIAQIDETLGNYKRAYDVETNPVLREQINRGITQLNAERRNILQRGSVPASNFDPTGKLGNVDPTLPTTPKTGKSYKIIKQEGIVDVTGEPVKVAKGVDTFIHAGDNGFVVSEATTGRFLSSSRTKEGAIAKAKSNINDVGSAKFKELISQNQLPTAPKTEVPTRAATRVAKALDPNDPLKYGQLVPKEQALFKATKSPEAKSSFANKTVQGSKEVSDEVKTQVKASKPVYTPTSDVDRITISDAYLKKQGVSKAATDVRERLNSKNIDDQTVSDAIATAKALDAKGSKQSLVDASDIYEKLSEKLTKAGQTVQAASLLSNRTPQGLQFSAIRTIRKEGVTLTNDIKQEITRLIGEVKNTQPGSYEDGLARFRVQQYVSKQIPSAGSSKAIQLWKAGLLTSPRTTAGNLLGNTSEAIFAKGYVDPLANVVDKLFSLFLGKRSRSYTLRGLASGTGEGIKKGISYFKTGYDPRNPAQKFDVRQIHYSDKPLGRAAEVYTQTVFKLMGVADQPFYYASLRNSLYDQAITSAKNNKLRGAEKQSFINKFVSEPDKKAMQLADAEARYTVFQNETALGTAASRIKSMEGIPGDVAEFVIPFSGVPSSIATRMVERTPIGTAIEIVKQIRSKKFDQRAMTKAIANGTAAIPLIGAGFALASNGEMTLGFPTDKKERDLWEAEGKQPYSIRIGNQWLSLNYMQPAGNLMAAGAQYAGEKLKGKSDQEAFNTALAGAGKAFSEQSFLKGVSGIGNAISDPTRFGQKFAEQTAGSIVPNFIRTSARANDPFARETNNIGDAVLSGIPGARETLPIKTNILGKPVERRSSTLDETINPFRPSDVKNEDNPIIKELRRLQDTQNGITPTEATKSSIEGIDDQSLRELNQKVASGVSGEWGNVIKDLRYAQLSDQDKKRILDRVNDTVFNAKKSDYKLDTKLTQRSLAYKNGQPIDYFDGFDSSTGVAKTTDKTSTAKKITKAKGSRTARRANGRSGKGSKSDYASLISATNKTAFANQQALQKLIKGKKITRRKIA